MIPMQRGPFTPWEEVLAAVQAEWEQRCDHAFHHIRYKENKVGQRSFWRQCHNCGKGLGQVPRRDIAVSQVMQARPYDTDREKERSRAILKEAQERYRTEYERATTPQGFWQRYDAYINSPRWRVVREKVMRRAGGVCEGCAEHPAEHVHHLTYDRLGAEMLFDLVAVCRACHGRIHKRSIG